MKLLGDIRFRFGKAMSPYSYGLDFYDARFLLAYKNI
jgi:hypothetical protein